MAAKQIAFDQEAREALRRGVGKLARAKAHLLAGELEDVDVVATQSEVTRIKQAGILVGDVEQVVAEQHKEEFCFLGPVGSFSFFATDLADVLSNEVAYQVENAPNIGRVSN